MATIAKIDYNDCELNDYNDYNDYTGSGNPPGSPENPQKIQKKSKIVVRNVNFLTIRDKIGIPAAALAAIIANSYRFELPGAPYSRKKMILGYKYPKRGKIAVRAFCGVLRAYAKNGT